MKQFSILNDSKSFFENLNDDEMNKLLERFGFEYEDISYCTNEIKSIKKYIQNIKINLYINRKKNLSISELNIIRKQEDMIDITNKSMSIPKKRILKEMIFNGYKLVESNYDEDNVELGAA